MSGGRRRKRAMSESHGISKNKVFHCKKRCQRCSRKVRFLGQETLSILAGHQN